MREIPTQLTMQETTEEYKQFVDKFKPKKTTDDCFTPPKVYRAVLDWVIAEYGISESDAVRPFYPGGDYERYEYEDSSVVVDNPPFSIISAIVEFYNQYGIKYFLFAPHLTNFAIGRGTGCCHVLANADVTYENGAIVATSFVTNLDERLIYAPHELGAIIKKADEETRAGNKKTIAKYDFPDNVITAAKIGWIVDKGVSYELKRSDGVFIRTLDSMKGTGKSIFGSGFLVSEKAAAEKAAAEKAAAEKAAAEKAAAEKAAAEKAAAIKWPLSRRELEIIKNLGR